jgi:hypothetical protein
MDTTIIDRFKERFVEEMQKVEHDFEAAEAMVVCHVRQLGRELLQEWAASQPKGYCGSSMACKCGSSSRFVQYRSKDVHSLYGWVTVKRAYYHCASCRTSTVPYDQASGLGREQLSPGLAQACCVVAVDDSFGQSSRKIEQLLGQRVSGRTIERLVHQVGAVELADRQGHLADVRMRHQAPEAQVQPKRLYVAVDGTTVHEEDGWHEVKLASVYWHDEHGNRHCRYVGSFEDSQQFGWLLWYAACVCGLREAEEIVYIGDGAAWIRTEHERHFRRATFIIDWYHASEHVWDCGKVLFGEGTEQTKRWVAGCLDLLWDGWTKKLLDALRMEHKLHRGRKREALGQLIRYISTNEEQMRYDVYRANGYDIGSGAVEGACKHVVAQRLKQAGMIWSRAGSSATLALRLAWLNSSWDRLWARKPLAA